MDYNNCYNEAIYYLQNKYGYRRAGFTLKASDTVRNLSVQKYNEVVASFSDKDYNLVTNKATEEEDKNIEIMLSQYYYGLEAKKTLYNYLLELKII